MVLITGLAGVLGRFAGRLLNSSLGWATVLLFGKVSGRKQWLLLGMAIGSLVWVVLVLGVVFPDLGAFLIAFVPLPSFVNKDVVRLVMLAGAILLPLLVGVAAVVVAEGAKRARGRGLIAGILRGYPFTLLLALTIAFLAVIATVRKVRALLHRMEDAHLPLVVKPGHYDDVLRQLDDVLRRGGLDIRQDPAPRVVSIPPRLLAKVAGSGIGSLVPDRLMLLKAKDLEILVYPSDLAITGTKATLAKARALTVSELTNAPAYLTTSAESEHIEDDLRRVVDQAEAAGAPPARDALVDVDRKLLELTVPFEEWETVYRERLQVERDLLVRDQPGAGPLEELAGGHPRDGRRAGRRQRRSGSPAGSSDKMLAAGALALLALDVAMQLLHPERREVGRRQGD